MAKGQTDLARLGRGVVDMARYSTAHWNAGARFWLEHRGPAVGRAIAGIDGPTIWLSGVRPHRLPYLTRVCSLVAQHTVVGHAGALPPFHLGLLLPLPTGNDIPLPPLERIRDTGPIAVPLIIDAVRRPLPPVSKRYLLGDESVPPVEGVLSYFPAGLLFSPLPGDGWPERVELLRKTGDLPDGRPGLVDHAIRQKAAGREEAQERYEAEETRDPIVRDEKALPPLSAIDIVALRLGQMLGADGPVPVQPIYDDLLAEGFERYTDARVYNDFWVDGTDAMRWEHRLAGAINAEVLYDPIDPPFVIQSKPLAVLDLEIPYLRSAPWQTILQLREDESEALEMLRRTIRRACNEVSDTRGTKAFDTAVRRVQELVVDKGLQDVKRAMSGSSGRAWGKFAGYSIAGIGLQLAVFLGAPELATTPAAAGLIGKGVDLILELRKDTEERRRRARSEMPLYFVWKLGQVRRAA